ncbi:MobC family plasmid mobilization relaxosome protein [Corynebacterium doosanense]|uniref:Bacterial mobilisation domain-containing protein n=1 Tax=Corynebacterium doosanense CAU 212 = DSM 45436 TaxID=558173 RepID=A0A097IJE5_9CORY|nr:MobC family plasmid mobilization relaxosome protein [Corynebacterium doosanense]AIT62228.1 hypothetical protein CDOO_03855 [Corynebacterium doosanense CAU 212 = DSM 45436]
MKLKGEVAKRLTIRLDAAAWGVVEAVARQLGITPAEVIRGGVHTLSDRLPPGWRERATAPPPGLVAELRALRLEVRRIGVNVNQSVRALHQRGAGADASVLSQQMAEIEAQLDELSGEVSARVCHDGG